ncbi:hypothetical protein BH09ACT1_BH09ACT1_10350 [soil metagenome]
MASDDTLFTGSDRADLVAISRVLYPHPQLADAPYLRTVASILDRASAEPLLYRDLVTGLDELRTAAGGGIAGAESAELRRLLRDRESTGFFSTMRSLVVWYLYDDHEVWEFVGYPGASFDQGGYLGRGFNDLDWLPDPRIEESAETLADIGPLTPEVAE